MSPVPFAGASPVGSVAAFAPLCGVEDADDFLARPTPAVMRLAGRLPAPVLVLGAGGKMGLHLSLMLKHALVAAGRGGERVIAVSRFTSLRD